MKVRPRAYGRSRRTPSRLALVGTAVCVLAVAGCGRSGDSESGGGQTTSSILVTTAAATAPTTTAAPTTTSRQLTYVIQSGDSLSVIAERFGITTKELADFNAITDPNSIKVNQEIAIPPTTIASSTTTADETTTTSSG